ncbi:lytic transglycosylase domain-containing protein [Mycetohabitans sp. B5]|uniref:Transglycosylase-like protein with SLT domain n=1 Tax=Mycetohabitans endofungorum TaxID=417203 RepID=A0A2P5KCG3_9BURK|nr:MULTISPECIES: transglycosylase SLT domain-containing protein [Mycetohabitans]MCG1055542.1 lytic transglycosylase domain-containing protein [Mycetohabitans sp. B5]PPB84391.1 transglycosylase-like protein with SLT domain [Mycetohabitans endofungorum]
MNTWLGWRPKSDVVQTVRELLRRGTRLSSTLLSLVGALAVLTSLALWWQPALRGTLAAKVMPLIADAVRNGPARLLSGQPLPPFAPHAGADGDAAPLGMTPLSATPGSNGSLAATFDLGYGDLPGGAGLNPTTLKGLDPRTLPSVGALARLIPSERVASDARDDRVLVSAREQALVATYLARRYRVAQEPIGQLVKAAFNTGREVGLDPLLLLAVMAIESGFNPYAESGVGAKGLMQVMSRVHSDKFDYFGGQNAALQPLANIKVGALVLKDCIARGGSVAGGLRRYVGSTSPNDGGYGAKVLAERARLREIARGRKVPVNAPQSPAPILASTTPQTNASTQRMQATLGAEHRVIAQKAPAGVDTHAQDEADASTASSHTEQLAEVGA